MRERIKGERKIVGHTTMKVLVSERGEEREKETKP